MEIIKKEKVNIKELIYSIEKGEVLVLPTDTVYGLVCDITNKKAVDRLFSIKQRLNNKFIPVFVKDINAAKRIAKIDKEQERFLKMIWPGKVTVILSRRKGIKLYGQGKDTIALRIPDNDLINKISRKLNNPLSGTSANISNNPSVVSVSELLKQLKGKNNLPDLIIDGGKLKNRKSSNIFDLTVKPIKILR